MTFPEPLAGCYRAAVLWLVLRTGSQHSVAKGSGNSLCNLIIQVADLSGLVQPLLLQIGRY